MTLPKKAYYHALKYGPSDETREIACKIPFFTYYYAKDVDKCPRDDTREAACKTSRTAYVYAEYVDKKPREDTRKAVCKSS